MVGDASLDSFDSQLACSFIVKKSLPGSMVIRPASEKVGDPILT